MNMRLLTVALLALALQGCASTPETAPLDNYLAPALRQLPQGALVVLLPPKMSSEEMGAGEVYVAEQLHRQLNAAGYQVKALDPANYALLWDQEVKIVGGIYDARTGELRTGAYGQALGALAQRIATDTGAALIISHGLTLRQAQLSGARAQWDGQNRPQPTSKGFGSDYRFDGDTIGISVELLGIAGDGSIAFKTHGGTSLPYRADVWNGKNSVRTDLFDKDEETAQGVRIALQPVLMRRP
jgi:hypothetical protein